jgi:hypothetical protein
MKEQGSPPEALFIQDLAGMGVPGISICDIPVRMTDNECGQAQVWENRKYQLIYKVHDKLLDQFPIAFVGFVFPDETDWLNID